MFPLSGILLVLDGDTTNGGVGLVQASLTVVTPSASNINGKVIPSSNS
jgi:hypothetical protein